MHCLCLYLYGIRHITEFSLQQSHSSLSSMGVGLLCLTQRQPVALPHLLWLNKTSARCFWNLSLVGGRGGEYLWVLCVTCGSGCSNCQLLCRPRVSGGVCVIKMGKRDKSSGNLGLLSSFLELIFSTSLLPKHWRSTLGDREETGKYLLKQEYLEN